MHLLNKFVCFYIFYFHFYKLIKAQNCLTEEIVNIDGKQLGLYTNTWYVIKNRETARYINVNYGSSDFIDSTLDPVFELWKRTQWVTFVSSSELGWYHIFASNPYGSNNNSNIGLNATTYLASDIGFNTNEDGYFYLYDYSDNINNAEAIFDDGKSLGKIRPDIINQSIITNMLLWELIPFKKFYESESKQSCDSENIIDINRNKLNLFTNEWYAIQNKATGRYISSCDKFNIHGSNLEDSFDLWNRGQWFIFIPMSESGWYSNLGFNLSKYDEYYYLYQYQTSSIYSFIYKESDKVVVTYSFEPGNEPTDDIYLWKFIPFERAFADSYNLNAIITNFEFTQPMEEEINNNKRKVSLIQPLIITNNGHVELHEVVANQVTKSELQTLLISQTITNKYKYLESIKISYSTQLNYLGDCDPISIEANFEYSEENSTATPAGREQTLSKDVTYSISKTIIVPLHYISSVKVSSYINWIDNLEIEYTADIDFTLSKKCGRFLQQNYTEYILDMIGFDKDLMVNKTEYTMSYPTDGVLKASIGLDLAFTVTNVYPDYDECTQPLQNPKLFYNSTNIKSNRSELKEKN